MITKEKYKEVYEYVRGEKDDLRARVILEELLTKYNFKTVLDVGSGNPHKKHSSIFEKCGKEVHTCDMTPEYNPTYEGNFLEIESKIPNNYYDCIWCSHTLEHQINPGVFLNVLKKKLKEGGILALTVPPMKHYIVPGHVNHWTPGMLLYNLVTVGFDCSKAITWAPSPDKFKGNTNSIHPYDISVLVLKKEINWEVVNKEFSTIYKDTWGDASVYEGVLYLSGKGLKYIKKYFPSKIEWTAKGKEDKDQQFDGRNVSQIIIK